MSTLNPPKTISKRHELRQDKVVTVYARAWEFFAENRTLVYGILAGFVVVVLSIVGFFVLQNQRAAEAQEKLGSILSQYEQGNFQEALDGTEGTPGLIAIADEDGSTDAGNLAHFYAADALFQLGKYDEALEHFEAFDKGDNLVGASAYAGEAAVYEQKGEFERAGNLYEEAAETYENENISPNYLLSAGQAFEQAGNFSKAKAMYQRIKDDYPESSLASGIDFYLARVEAEMQ